MNNKLHSLQSKLWIVTFPLAIGLVWLVVTQVGWRIFFEAIDNFSPLVWVFTLICTFTELYFQLLRSWVMLRVDIPDLKFWTVAKAGLAAFSAGSFTPGRVGDSALILLIPGASTRAIGIALVDRIMFWPPMHILGSIGLGVFFLPKFGMMGLGISILIGILYFALMEWVFHITRAHHKPLTSRKFFVELYHGFTALPKKVWRLGLLLGLVQYIIIMIQFRIGLWAIGSKVSIFDSGVIFACLQLLRSFVAFTPGNLGTSEIIGMVLGSNYAGLSPDTLPQITIPFFLTNTVIPALIGFPLWISMSRQLKRHQSND